MGIYYRQTESNIVVFGQTFLVKDHIRSLGGSFNYVDKTWILPFNEQNLANVIALCGGKAGATTKTANEETTTSADGLSIRDLLMRASSAIQREFPNHVWIIGEIENVSHKNGHVFLQLAEPKDDRDVSTLSVKAAIWSSTMDYLRARHTKEKLNELLNDGMKIRCNCRVEFYKDRGQLSLVIEDIDPEFTKGALALAREKLLKKLRSLGLDQKNKLVPRPTFPFRIGLISAEGSRAYSDFVDQLYSNAFSGEVIFASASMQGDLVQKSVKDAFEKLAKHDCDLVVLTRGGGSAADLRWFDSEEIAITIANYSVPVIAAIGHHDDVCVAEEICHLRQKTPTAAADFILDSFRAVALKIEQIREALSLGLNKAVDDFSKRMNLMSEAIYRYANGRTSRETEKTLHLKSIMDRTVSEKFFAQEKYLDSILQSIERKTFDHLHHQKEIVGNLLQKITELDPSPWMKKGWTQLLSQNGKVLSVDHVAIGAHISARLKDGKLDLVVQQKEAIHGKD